MKATQTLPTLEVAPEATKGRVVPIASNDPRVVAVASAIVALLDGVTANAARPTTDELIPLTVEGLAARQLEHRPIMRLADSGKLRTVRIGRRRYTRPSWLAAVAEVLPTTRQAVPSASDKREALLEELRGRRWRART